MKEAVTPPEGVQTPIAVINSLNASYSKKYRIQTKTDDVACPKAGNVMPADQRTPRELSVARTSWSCAYDVRVHSSPASSRKLRRAHWKSLQQYSPSRLSPIASFILIYLRILYSPNILRLSL